MLSVVGRWSCAPGIVCAANVIVGIASMARMKGWTRDVRHAAPRQEIHSQRLKMRADSSESLQNDGPVNDCRVRSLRLHVVARLQIYLYPSCSRGHVASPTPCPPDPPDPPSRSRPPQPSAASVSGLGHHVDRADVNEGQAQDAQSLPCAGLLATHWNVKRTSRALAGPDLAKHLGTGEQQQSFVVPVVHVVRPMVELSRDCSGHTLSIQGRLFMLKVSSHEPCASRVVCCAAATRVSELRKCRAWNRAGMRSPTDTMRKRASFAPRQSDGDGSRARSPGSETGYRRRSALRRERASGWPTRAPSSTLTGLGGSPACTCTCPSTGRVQ